MGDTSIDNNNNNISVDYKYNYYAPKASTYCSAVDYTVGVTTIAMSAAGVQLGHQQVVEGEVCESDWHVALSCKHKGYKE